MLQGLVIRGTEGLASWLLLEQALNLLDLQFDVSLLRQQTLSSKHRSTA